jgi:hypothetical protein
MEVTRITELWKFVHNNTVSSPNNKSRIRSKQVDADPQTLNSGHKRWLLRSMVNNYTVTVSRNSCQCNNWTSVQEFSHYECSSFTFTITLFCSVSNALQWKHGNWWWFVPVLWRQWILSVEYFAIRTTQWQAVSLHVTMMAVIWAIMFSPTFHFLELRLCG